MKNRRIIPFIIITACFALWGFANDITNPMVKAFSKIFRMSVTDGTLVQVAFYGGYFAMALPAALFIKKYSYKAGILLGLGLYAAGSLLFLPARMTGDYYPFLAAYFILTCGLSFLETSANPYIISMGDPATATRRLNLAQSFNPIGSLMGMYVAMNFIQAKLNPLSTSQRAVLDDASFEAVKTSDLAILTKPYIAIAAVIIIILIFVLVIKIPEQQPTSTKPTKLSQSLKTLIRNARYRRGVVAEFFYVGAQIMCWTFIIQYGTRIFMREGLTEQAAEILSQRYNILAMIIFCASRFLCTYLQKFINPAKLLKIMAIAGAILVCGVVFIDGRAGLYCLIGVSACMSLMFPTIYGIALEEVPQEAKIGAAGLVMSILGGSLLPALQAAIIDSPGTKAISSVNISFIVPFFCFVVVAVYGWQCRKISSAKQ